ncbi:hypothetical protein VKS41_006128 [Umbelopsis sp. WA50703]
MIGEIWFGNMMHGGSSQNEKKKTHLLLENTGFDTEKLKCNNWQSSVNLYSVRI